MGKAKVGCATFWRFKADPSNILGAGAGVMTAVN
eukprot:CAMPEP_0174370284 /NCGR_PEP_ID=MMETSP0811_2-20130205/95604_1 /TAXON_ID=73025 ORGANISM="Eutreptiella gymnastica-like, Strain CCMP1594" /NCGR_SAMPLE_ID=MMETSP0811_2 /ASSEMBLY_ACC=CAM_ASM_000667 /LENGTH=33 /DNA_ID= /DNA_START= /DNA_END= /DNA_ORIENTATION=